MRLLYLALTLPAPPNNGHKIRSWLLLRALAAEGHQTTLLSFATPHELDGNLTQLREVCEHVDVIPLALTSLSGTGDYSRRLRGLFSTLPYTGQRYRSPQMQQRIRERLAEGPYDAVVCDTIFSLLNLPPTSVPIVLNNVDVEHVILQRYLDFERNPAKWAYAWVESRKVLALEQAACERATLCMACSEHDRAVLARLAPCSRFVVAPNVIDVDNYVPEAGEEENTVVYLGGMDWFPNRDAVRFFAHAVLPQLRRLTGNVKFIVAGRNPPEEFVRCFREFPEVQFTGTVPDVRPILARAAVCVVSLRIGSGTRLKILEAAAMAKPIVSTQLGAEGLEFEEGREILLADEPHAFAQAVAGLLADRGRRRALGEAARQCVEAKYSMTVLRAALRRGLAQLQAKPSLESSGAAEQSLRREARA